jgi:hypothetical protein
MVLASENHELNPIGYCQLVENRKDLFASSRLGNAQASGQLSAREPVAYPLNYAAFSGGERLEGGVGLLTRAAHQRVFREDEPSGRDMIRSAWKVDIVI